MPKKIHTPMWKKPWQSLSPEKKATRLQMLEVLSLVRQGQSLRKAAKKLDANYNTALRHLSGALIKTSKGFIAKQNDKIERPIRIKERGLDHENWVLVPDYKQAQMLSRYHDAVKRFLNEADMTMLKSFDGLFIVDSSRDRHYFETQPSRIRAIEETIEERELHDIYRR